LSGSEAVAIGLLRSHAVLTPGETTVLLGSGIEALIGESAAQVAPGWVYVCDSDLRTLQRAAPQLEHVSNAELVEQATLPTSLHGRCSSVLLLAPPQRDLARRWLVEAYTALREGGTLWLAGAKAEGIESVIDDAGALFGQTHVLGYRKGSRVAQAIRQPEGHRPPWASEPGIVPGTWQQVMVELPQGATEFLSLPGVFAYDRLDAGTALLLQQMDLQGGERVLDIGCGCGIFLAQHRSI
jgi:16S rRNA (guanine1207-N2)-methyltransferase